MSYLCQEARLPPAVRMQRALRLSAEELGIASLDDIVALASELCKMQVYPDFAIDFFNSEYQDFTIQQVGKRFLVRRVPTDCAICA